MYKPRIVAHCLVKNEERFIWYALNSVLPFVDEIFVWDTLSTDDTVKIIKSISSPKIKFNQLESVNALTHTQVRQQMLDTTPKNKFDWLMVLDGDEIWTPKAFKIVKQAMQGQPVNSLVVHSANLVGDIYHRLPESAGQYHFAGQKGHLNLRFIKLNLPELKVVNPHGGQTYQSQGKTLQNQTPPQLQVIPATYFHVSHLTRSKADKNTLKRSFKKKFELGQKIAKKDLPSIFFETRPEIVPAVTQKMSPLVYLVCLLQTPFRRLKRRLITPRSGYIYQK